MTNIRYELRMHLTKLQSWWLLKTDTWKTIEEALDSPFQNIPQFIVSLPLAAHCFLKIIWRFLRNSFFFCGVQQYKRLIILHIKFSFRNTEAATPGNSELVKELKVKWLKRLNHLTNKYIDIDLTYWPRKYPEGLNVQPNLVSYK